MFQCTYQLRDLGEGGCAIHQQGNRHDLENFFGACAKFAGSFDVHLNQAGVLLHQGDAEADDRQDEGDEMFGSSKAARAIVRFCQWGVESVAHIFPASLRNWINSRFNANEVELVDDKAAFDVVRAAAAHLVRLGRVQRCELQFGCASGARCGDCTLACGARPDTLGR